MGAAVPRFADTNGDGSLSEKEQEVAIELIQNDIDHAMLVDQLNTDGQAGLTMDELHDELDTSTNDDIITVEEIKRVPEASKSLLRSGCKGANANCKWNSDCCSNYCMKSRGYCGK